MMAPPHTLSVTLRSMTLADVPQVHHLDTLSFSLPWSERSFRFEVNENPNSVVWVAEAAQNETESAPREVIGMAVVWVILDEAHIATIATHPDYRGWGVGRLLLARSLLVAYERGARLAYLEVRRGNLTAQHMYQRFGFAVVGERRRYYQDNGEDALLMTLDPLLPAALEQAIVRGLSAKPTQGNLPCETGHQSEHAAAQNVSGEQ